MRRMAMRPVEILLVEDNPGDVRLTVEGLQEARVYNNLHIAQDGIEAMEFLHREGSHIDAPRPDMILLDLNLPRKDGREVLAEIKADELLKRIPVVILTTSQDEVDIFNTYDLHANCYISKPLDFEQFMRIVQSVRSSGLPSSGCPPNSADGKVGEGEIPCKLTRPICCWSKTTPAMSA